MRRPRLRTKKKDKIETKRVYKTKALPNLANSTTKKLQMLTGILGQLYSDENFVTLLEAESMTAIPATLRSTFEAARKGHESGHEIQK
jgi:hypothetical protein